LFSHRLDLQPQPHVTQRLGTLRTRHQNPHQNPDYCDRGRARDNSS
jgi:hypothetical protein